jgi:hypothetical protein
METHDHDHDHPKASDEPMPGYYEIMEIAVRELLIEKRLIGPGEIRRQIEVLDSRTPALGAKVVARAWVDPGFRARLLASESRVSDSRISPPHLRESNCVPSQAFLGAFCMLWIPRNTRFDYGVHDRQHLVHASDQRDFFEFSVSKQTFIKGLDDGVVTYGT